MRFTGPRLMALPLLLAACTNSAPRPHRLTGSGVSPAVWGVLEVPQTPGPHEAVILLPGSYGWRPDYARFARAFADSGFVTLAPQRASRRLRNSIVRLQASAASGSE